MSEASAYVLMIDNPAGSAQLYERMRQEIALPAGGTLHIAGPDDDGHWRVIEVFASKEEATTFLQERLGPALRAAGATGPPPFEMWPVYNLAVTDRHAAPAAGR
jgi:hypothetical protein